MEQFCQSLTLTELCISKKKKNLVHVTYVSKAMKPYTYELSPVV